MATFNFAVWIIGSFCALLLVIKFIFTGLTFLSPKRKFPPGDKKNSFACIITAYQNIEITRPLVLSILQQNYRNYHIYLVADDCASDDYGIEHNQLTVIKPETRLGSKVRSMHYAIKFFEQPPDFVIIFDPDNLIHPDFFFNINTMINNGYQVVQGERKAKNLDTRVACIDALGEIYANHTSRLIPFQLGASASIAGSGMAIAYPVFLDLFEYRLIKQNFNGIILGEDKALQCFLLENNVTVAYQKEAVVYDEKISKGYQIQRQRARWANTYLQNFPVIMRIFFRNVVNFNFKGVLSAFNIIYPPMFLLIIFSLFVSLVGAFAGLWITIILLIALIIFSLNFLLVLFLSNSPRKIWSSLFYIPVFIFHQVIGLFNIGKSKKDFLATRNEKIMTVEEVMLKNNGKLD